MLFAAKTLEGKPWSRPTSTCCSHLASQTIDESGPGASRCSSNTTLAPPEHEFDGEDDDGW